ncbi:unnamed protein product [Zymoseptoria tritici ST99CH_1E4]|uniref:Uncharacterized protein n=1 Tax=Zymoseptoria tritici ST99CH_1E4 TaxID=1276532 RepID=A0A2H1H4R8_ZYMTR|nr:unnamed protein product [Zymoseptoria tritici ST99CH_1E4]
MERHTRSSSKPISIPSASGQSVARDAPHALVMDRKYREIINLWEWRTMRLTLFRSAVTISLLMMSVPGLTLASDATSDGGSLFERLASSGYVAAGSSLLLLLIGVSYSGRWLIESNPEEVNDNWSAAIKADAISYGRVSWVSGASYIVHRFLVPLLTAWTLNTTGCSCSSGPRMDQFKTVVNSTGVFLLSSAVIWSIPNRLALLQHSTFRDTAALVLLAVFGYVLCLAGVYVASLKAGEAFCYQAGGKCAGEIVLKVVDLAGKIGRRDFGKLDSVIGWSMTALGLHSKKE